MNRFEWDENKRLLNIEKHGIDFVDALHIFDDVDRIELETFRNNEQRFLTIGQVEGVVILLVYVNRAEKVRIISARRASFEERKYYE